MSVRTRYILALSLIALLVTASATYLQTIFVRQEQDSLLINKAGQQRMLVNRVALFVHRLAGSHSDYDAKSLASSLQQFADNHAFLSTLPALPLSVEEMYFGKVALDTRINRYVDDARQYLSSPVPAAPTGAFHPEKVTNLLNDLDDVVSLFEGEAKQRVAVSMRVEKGLWILTLIVLAMEAMLIFRPMENSIKRKIRQLTEAKQDAEQSEAKALEASKVKSEFLANMSHEIRTPMNGILGTLQILESTILDEKSRDMVSKASISARSLLTIINDILDYSKIEANKLSLEPSNFAFLDVVDSVKYDLKLTATEKGIDLKVEVSPEFVDGWYGDEVRIRQILLNLVSNAVKFTEQGSVIINVSSSITETDATLFVKVTDTGIGISEEQQKQIFERFTQVDGSSTKRYQGTGLGMPISMSLIRLMEGKLELESDEGQGTKVTVELPLKQANLEEISEHSSPTEAPRLVGVKILIAEDNVINKTIIEAMLEDTGASLEFAENGRLAVEACEKQTYDLILMDIHMPEMDGIEAFSRIKQFAGDIPVIALTANIMAEDIQLYEEAGFAAHIGKPVDISQLYKTLNHFLR